MAEQREPIARRVALRIIKVGMATRQVIARFSRAEALGQWDPIAEKRVLKEPSSQFGGVQE